MKYVFAGTPNISAHILEELIKRGYPPALIITRPDAPVGRKRVMTPSAVAEVGEVHGIEVYKTTRIDSEVDTKLDLAQYDMGLVIAYGALIRDSALTAPDLGWFNLHYSLLPQYRGAAPIQRALFEKKQSSGMTLFQLDAGMDTGPVFSRMPCDFLPDETASEALERFSSLAVEPIIELLGTVTNLSRADLGTHLKPQLGDPSFAEKFSPGEELLAFSDTIKTFYAQFLGLTTEPGAQIELSGNRIKLHQIRPVRDEELMQRLYSQEKQQPVLNNFSLKLFEKRVFLRLKDGYMELITVQPAGKKAMNAADWFRGLK